MRKIIAVTLCLILVGYYTIPAFATEYYGYGENVDTDEDNCYIDVPVDTSNLADVIENYQLPDEVAERLSELMTSDSNNLEVSVSVPAPQEEADAGINSSPGNWGYVHTYKGYTLQNYEITIRNAFEMTTIIGPSREASTFSRTIFVYSTGTLIDSMLPFGVVGSAAVTLIDYLLAEGQKVSVHAGDGDKLSAAPYYLTYETFVYVKEENQMLLGARVYYTYLNGIVWYYYKDGEVAPYSTTTTYEGNNVFKSPNHDNMNELAIHNYVSTTVLDGPVYIDIGGIRFYLS